MRVQGVFAALQTSDVTNTFIYRSRVKEFMSTL